MRNNVEAVLERDAKISVMDWSLIFNMLQEKKHKLTSKPSLQVISTMFYIC